MIQKTYAKYQISDNIAENKVYGLLHMAFCHILPKVCAKIFASFKNIVNFRNVVEIAFQRDIDFPACDAYNNNVAITAYWFDFQSKLTPIP